MVLTRKTQRNTASPLPEVTAARGPASARKKKSSTPTSAESVGSVSTGGRKRNPLKINIQVQLAEDIEAAGGIDAFQKETQGQALRKLCDKRKKTCGDAGDPLRKRIANKVTKWKELSKADYLEKALLRFNVKSNCLRKKDRDPLTEDEDEGDVSDSETLVPRNIPFSTIAIPQKIEEGAEELSDDEAGIDEDSKPSFSAQELPTHEEPQEKKQTKKRKEEVITSGMTKCFQPPPGLPANTGECCVSCLLQLNLNYACSLSFLFPWKLH